jgi:hypothetical protein
MQTLGKNLISLILIAAVAYIGFWYLTRPDATGFAHVTVSDAASSSPASEFAALLSDLKAVDFQGANSVFTDPAFRALTSFRRELPLIDRVRANPFAPVDGNSAAYIHYGSPVPTSLTPVAPAGTSTASSSPAAAPSSGKKK